MSDRTPKYQPQSKTELNTLVFGKVPPQAAELEEAVLGACMLERDAFEEVMAILKPDDFYKDAHQKIWQAMCDLHGKGDVVDLLTITEALRKSENLELVGGIYALNVLTMSVTSSAHVKEHAFIVKEKSMLRNMIRIAGEIITAAYDPTTDVFELQDTAEKQLQGIADGIGGDDAESVGAIYMDLVTEMEENGWQQKQINGFSSGYRELDSLTCGFSPSQLVIIAARPSQGKTALMLNLAENAVCSPVNRCGKAVIYSLETGKKPLIKRMAACRLSLPLKAIKTCTFLPREIDAVERAVTDFNNLPIFINDEATGLTHIINSVKSQYKKYIKTKDGKAGLPMAVFIDYLQLIETEKSKGTREQEVSKISRSLKVLAKQLNITVFALCQFGRGIENRANKRPMPSDLRESGAIEQDADVIIAIYHEEGENNTINTKLCVLKNKDGELGDVQLNFAGDIQKWKEFEQFETFIPASFVSHFQQDNPHKGINNKTLDWDA